MKLAGRVVVITGAGAGIGAALAARIAREAPAGLVLGDVDEAALDATADRLGALAVPGDAGCERDVGALVDAARARFGRVDVFVANAGVMRGRWAPGADDRASGAGVFASERDWTESWSVNVMGHVRAARLLVPEWIERGSGCFVAIASAAGLLSELGSAAYTVTKHAAVGFAEWLAITYGALGVQVACVCPLGVETSMVTGAAGVEHLRAEMIAPDAVADAVVEGIAQGRFLILPHPQAREYARRKVDDVDRWLDGMRRLRRAVAPS